jgi:enolase-phosphatase E1
MPRTSSARAILLDIEGTVAPIAFVHEVLFPYARKEMNAYLRARWSTPPVAAARLMLEAASAEFSEQSLASLKAKIFDLMDRDVKSTGLKQLQGLIWEEGYRAGAFQSPVYPDVAPALHRWSGAGKIIAIYSSGRVAAQKVFFQHTVAGDLTPFLSGFYDTTTGPKKSASSYTAIAKALKFSPDEMLFISDVAEEVEAARSVGLDGIVVLRPGNATTAFAGIKIKSFDQVL